MDVNALIRIERLNYLLGGALVAVSAFAFSRSTAFGVLVGVALSCANFTVMRFIVGRMLDKAATSHGLGSFLLIPKMALLMTAVALAILFLPINGEGLAIGFSIFLVSIGVETVRFLSRPAADPSAGRPADSSQTGASDSGAGDVET